MSDAYTAGPLAAWTHNPAHARMQEWSREVLVEKCRAFHGRLPRAEAGDLQISPERLACATSTSATTNSSPPVMDMSVSNEEYGASTVVFACCPSLPVDPAFRPPQRRAQARAMPSLQHPEPPSCRLLRLCGAAASYHQVKNVKGRSQRPYDGNNTWFGSG